jgi:hypothetical protein
MSETDRAITQYAREIRRLEKRIVELESSDQTPALRARIMELEQALVNHGEHRSPCLRRYNPQKPCTCGLSALLSSSPAERTET